MKLMMLGPPGVGKGTQSVMLGEALSIPTISTGQIIREFVKAGHPRSSELLAVISSGQLVEDELMIEIVKFRLAKADCANGYILDGFPRTVNQAEALMDQKVVLDYVFNIVLDDEAIIERLSGRLYHPDSGRVYHKVFNPPKITMKDDVTGDDLIIRPDDHPDAIKKRLELFRAETAPLIDFYQQKSPKACVQFVEVNGSGSVDAIQHDLLAQIK